MAPKLPFPAPCLPCLTTYWTSLVYSSVFASQHVQSCIHWSSLASQWLSLHASTVGGTGLIPCWGSSTCHMMQPKNKTILISSPLWPTAALPSRSPRILEMCLSVNSISSWTPQCHTWLHHLLNSSSVLCLPQTWLWNLASPLRACRIPSTPGTNR